MYQRCKEFLSHCGYSVVYLLRPQVAVGRLEARGSVALRTWKRQYYSQFYLSM
jgi:hypothetical protein